MIRCSRSWLTDNSIFNHIIEMKTLLYSLLFLLAFTLPGNASGSVAHPPIDQAPPVIITEVTHPTVPEPKTKTDIMATVMDHVIWATISPRVRYGAPGYEVDFVDASFITHVTLRNQLTGACYQATWADSNAARIEVPELAGEWLLTVTVIGGDSVSFVFVAI